MNVGDLLEEAKKDLLKSKIARKQRELRAAKDYAESLHPQFDCHLTHKAGERVAGLKGEIRAYEEVLKEIEEEGK